MERGDDAERSGRSASSGRHTPIEELEVFQRFVTIADWAWRTVSRWPPLAVDTVGKQLVRASDRIGATLVEGDGRYSDVEAAHFFVIARASAREARYWIRCAVTRNLVAADDGEARIAELADAAQMLNALIRYRRSRARPRNVRETAPQYDASSVDPLTGEE
jgi:four helix bundle protein